MCEDRTAEDCHRENEAGDRKLKEQQDEKKVQRGTLIRKKTEIEIEMAGCSSPTRKQDLTDQLEYIISQL